MTDNSTTQNQPRDIQSYLKTTLEIFEYGFTSIAVLSHQSPAWLDAKLTTLCERVRTSTDEEFSRIAGKFMYRIALTLNWKTNANRRIQ